LFAEGERIAMRGGEIHIDLYDYLMLAVLIVLAIAFMVVVIFIGGLPGKIALKRRHPHAETVKIMGWMGFLAVIPWVHAFIWAFHDSLTIDIRRFPKEEEEAVEKELESLGAVKKEPAEPEEKQ
jgi:amino acid transporter